MAPSPAAGKRQAVIIKNDEWEPKAGYEDAPHQARRVAWVGLGGILILLAGVLGIADAVVVTGMLSDYELLDTDSVVCSALIILFGVLAIVGGLMAMLRLNYPIAVIGGVCGIFAYGCAFGSILSIIGLILIVAKRKAFSS